MKYRKKPVTVEAFQFDGTVECLAKHLDKKNWHLFTYCANDTDGSLTYYPLNQPVDLANLVRHKEFNIETLEGMHRLSAGDYVIQGVQGEYYPCKPDIFKQTYVRAES